MPKHITINTISKTLAAATPLLLAPAHTQREFLTIQNTGGTNPMTFKTGSAPASATDGICLDPATIAGGQGGSYEFRDRVPVDAIYGYSTNGTTVLIFDGSDAGY
ncbi:hypothetical protein QA633_40005 [Bradyrhizobium barranii]|uniref:hypothetical protein n=1 Tax=Bradyrhizobium barranii TaxID=2992140 RepID=UPI0024AFE19D|nr:hypothetical protein [Bradyrhizobium barranii]WFT94376.1 hypothetical protein QA633_40005 [Bradyrhizobium barranii]